MWPVFADPKSDFVFKRIFGNEAHKHLLVALLNAVLDLEEDHRITDVSYLTPEQSVPLPEMKLSIVDVKCRDQQGFTYVVEMQVLNVEEFEKRLVYNASKAYTMQLAKGDAYRDLAPVVGVTICDFVFWSENGSGPPSGGPVPMLSRWRMQEHTTGARGLADVQYVFVELPKYNAGTEPERPVDRWAYLFREAEHFKEIPPVLQESPYKDALEIARVAHFTRAEWDQYDQTKMAEQDARGAISLAHKQGEAQGEARGEALGEARGMAKAILRLFQSQGSQLDAEHRRALLDCRDTALLTRWLDKAVVAGSALDVLAELGAIVGTETRN